MKDVNSENDLMISFYHEKPYTDGIKVETLQMYRIDI